VVTLHPTRKSALRGHGVSVTPYQGVVALTMTKLTHLRLFQHGYHPYCRSYGEWKAFECSRSYGRSKKTRHVGLSFELELGLHRSNTEGEKPALRAVNTRSHAKPTPNPRASGLRPRATSPRTRLGYLEVRVRRVLLRVVLP